MNYICCTMEFSKEYYKNMFVQRFNELERYHNEMSNYSMIRASENIRFLLLDSQPLIDVLNRDKQLPVTYCVNNDPFHDEDEKDFPVLIWREINTTLSSNPVHLKKDAFLKHICLRFLQKSITVRDIIKFYAFVRGGVHLDRGEKEYEPLREAFNTMKLNGLSSLDHSMRGIVQVIYTTLNKHKEALLAS